MESNGNHQLRPGDKVRLDKNYLRSLPDWMGSAFSGTLTVERTWLWQWHCSANMVRVANGGNGVKSSLRHLSCAASNVILLENKARRAGQKALP